MTNSLIPHTFIPGTKARAQEVNANFIALAEEIQSSQQNTASRFAQVNDSMHTMSEEAEQKYADIDLVKTKTLSNVILKAPNGVITYDGQTVTVKNGLVVLIPSGLNSEGKPESVQYTLSSDVSKIITNMANVNSSLFLYSNGTVDVVNRNIIFYSDTSATNDGAYKFVNNKWYKYSATEGVWQEVFAVPVADIVWDANSVISSVNSYGAADILTRSDLKNDNQLKGLLPSNVDYVVETFKGNNVSYRRYKSGWVEISGRHIINVYFGGGSAAEYVVNLPMAVDIYSVYACGEAFCFTVAAFVSNSTTIRIAVRNAQGSSFTLPAARWEVKGYAI